MGSQRLKTLENCISILIDDPSSGSSNNNKEIDELFKELNSDAIKFQELYYLERQHIKFLDKQRCGNFIASWYVWFEFIGSISLSILLPFLVSLQEHKPLLLLHNFQKNLL